MRATATAYGYDAVSRLNSLGQDLAGSGSDMSQSFSRNPASQLSSQTTSNDAWAWSGAADMTAASVQNGLNQTTNFWGATIAWDTRGALSGDGSFTYAYDLENRMTGIGGAISNLYGDPGGRAEATKAVRA